MLDSVRFVDEDFSFKTSYTCLRNELSLPNNAFDAIEL